MAGMAGIVSKRYRNGQLEYEVKWLGREETTWKPATDYFAPQFIGDFEHRLKQEKAKAERQRMTAARKRFARNPFWTEQEETTSDVGKSVQAIGVDEKINVTCIGKPTGRCDISGYAAQYKRFRIAERRYDFTLSLEEIFAGGVRNAHIRGDDNITETLSMWLPPGCLAGTEREFELDDGTAITLVVRDKPHKDFRREGSDLHHTHRLPLRDALLGAVVNIHSFTGELVKLTFDQPIPHGSVKRIAGKGFPHPDDPSKRGDLVVTFDVVFPDYVDEEYHEDIKRLL